ncbi:MAG: hypothetical protein HY812_21080 [Planctomycetes bacterium]|nr:hypothetical protein [Planctomycetota bacterium]
MTMLMRWLLILVALLTPAAPVAPAWAARRAESCCGGGGAICRCCASAHLAPGAHPIARKPHRCPCTEPAEAPPFHPFTALIAPEAPHGPDFGLPPHPPVVERVSAGAPGLDLIPAFGLPPPPPAGLPVLYCSFLC